MSAAIPVSQAGKCPAGEGDLGRILTTRPSVALPRLLRLQPLVGVRGERWFSGFAVVPGPREGQPGECCAGIFGVEVGEGRQVGPHREPFAELG